MSKQTKYLEQANNEGKLTAGLINKLIGKFGNKCQLLHVDRQGVIVRLGPKRYRILLGGHVVMVDGDDATNDQYADWLEGVLTGGVRNDAGEIVDPRTIGLPTQYGMARGL